MDIKIRDCPLLPLPFPPPTSQQDTIQFIETPTFNPHNPSLLGHLATLKQLPHLFKSLFTLSERRPISNTSSSSSVNHPPHSIMSTIVEKVSDAVNDVTAALSNTSLSDNKTDKPTDTDKTAHNDAVLASAAEGRRLYIGNLAYATTEGELQTFFKGYLM